MNNTNICSQCGREMPIDELSKAYKHICKDCRNQNARESRGNTRCNDYRTSKGYNMRFALRNKNKIKNTYSQELVDSVLSALKAAQSECDIMQMNYRVENNSPYPTIVVKSVDGKFNLVRLYVLSKQYDVYHLALKEFIG